MCQECKRKFIAYVVQDTAKSGYRAFTHGLVFTEEGAAEALVIYATKLYDKLVEVIGEPHGPDGVDLEDWLHDDTRH